MRSFTALPLPLLVCLWSPLAGPARAESGATSKAPPTTEARIINVHPSWYWQQEDIDERRQAMREMMDDIEAANFNMIRIWLESPHIATLFGEPRYVESGRYDFWNTNRWDPVKEILDAAEQRDLAVQFWYSFTRYKRDRNWTPEYDPDNQVLPPGDPDWASIKKSEYQAGHTDPADPQVEGSALCNNEFETIPWTLKVVDMVFERYPRLAGFHIEEPGYLNVGRCVCYRCQKVYSQLHGGEPGENLLDHVYEGDGAYDRYRDDSRAIPVKTNGTNAFVFAVVDHFQQHYPGKILSTGGGTNVVVERARGRNWIQWVHWDLLTNWGNQAYTKNNERFESLLKEAMNALEGSDVRYLPYIGIGWGSRTHVFNTPETVVKQIELARGLDGHKGVDVAGVALFAAQNLDDELVEALRSGPFRRKAKLPWPIDQPPKP